MKFHEILAEELQRVCMKPAEFARRMHVHPSLVSRWLSGKKPMTLENIQRASVILGSCRLRMYYNSFQEVSILPLEVLDCVDLNPAVVQLKLDEELGEALQSLRKLSLVNKRQPTDLTPEQREDLTSTAESLADVLAAIEHFVLAAQETLGLDPMTIKARWSKKVRNRGYCRGEGNLVHMITAAQGGATPRQTA